MNREADKARRRRAYELGHRAEWIAVAVLTLHGWRILARRYIAPGGEIDLIARRGDTVAFVEVKARPTLDEASTTITAQKIARISRAAGHWLGRNRWAAAYNLRGDARFIGGWAWPRRIEAAFHLDIF